MGIQRCVDLHKYSISDLVGRFGSHGGDLYYLSRGIDDREVETNRERKSFSLERTFKVDLATIEECKTSFDLLIRELSCKLDRKLEKFISGCFVKLKFCDFSETTSEQKN